MENKCKRCEKIDEIEIIKDDGMTFWKLKEDNAWSRDIIALLNYLKPSDKEDE